MPVSFNPRVRGGRDNNGPELLRVSCYVSIHASAGDATSSSVKSQGCFSVSIHASAGDATYILYPLSADQMFQSTRPRGTRPKKSCIPFNINVVSIHASAGDATRRPPRSCLSSPCFNPRVRGGRDAAFVAEAAQKPVSIHASAGDATCYIIGHYLTSSRFQSTRPRGTRRIGNGLIGLSPIVSIHASAGDATQRARRSCAT